MSLECTKYKCVSRKEDSVAGSQADGIQVTASTNDVLVANVAATLDGTATVDKECAVNTVSVAAAAAVNSSETLGDSQCLLVPENNV